MKLFSATLLFVLIAWLFVSGCKKKEPVPPDMEETPVFYCNATLNNFPYTMQAGVNDYYMFSSFYYDSLPTLYSFRGELSALNCVNCPKITFDIRDNAFVTIGNNSNIDSLIPGEYKYWAINKGYDTTISINFHSKPIHLDSVASVLWDFGDGTTSTLPDVEHYYAIPKLYNVCHTIYYKNQCIDQLCYVVDATEDNNCGVDIEYTNSSNVIWGDTVRFKAITSMTSTNFLWEFGDGKSDTGLTTSHFYGKAGVYTVKLTSTLLSATCQATQSARVGTPRDFPGCTSNFNYEKNTSLRPSKKNIITLKWVDTLGNVYTTGNTPQPPDAYFRILSIQNYLVNEKNQRTKKIHALFKCNLSDGNKIITIANAETVFAVAYP